MAKASNETRKRPTPGRAVDDEDPSRSPMDNAARPAGPAQPLDIDRVEEDRSKSTGSAKRGARPSDARKR